MKKRVLALICAAVVGVTSLTVSASAATTWVEASAEAIATAIWELSKASMQISLEQFCYIVENNWIYNAVDYTLTDPDTGIIYGFEEYYNDDGSVAGTRLVRSGRSGGGGRVRVDTASDVEIGGKTFAEICAQLQEQYAPKADTKYISWKNEKNPNLTNTLSLYANGTFCNQSDWYEVYLVPFFYDGTTYYYGDLQYHFYNSDDLLAGEIYNNIEILSSGLDGYTPTSGVIGNNLYLSKYPYLSVGPFFQHYSSTTSNHMGYVPGIFYYPDYTSYLSGTTQYSGSIYSSSYWNVCFYRSDITTTVCAQEQGFKANFVVTDGVKDMSTPCDIGFLVSDSFIELTGSIPDNWEMDKIPGNYYVTFDGDNIYNYTITDPDTGGTSTVNEYVTNNYTIINNNYGDSDGDDSGSSGGTTSGDINVGGNIGVNGNVGVNGQVDVNLNVNVNTGSGGSGGTAEVDPYEYEKVNMGEALEQIPEMSDGFTGFLSDVFDFLPPPVLGLIIGGIGLAILCRIAGR